VGKSKPKMEVTEYYMSLHFGICNGPIDALLGITVKEKSAWNGHLSDLDDITISNPNFFGGVKKEGGLGGVATYLPGRSDQVLPDNLAVKLGRTSGEDCPGFRGLASLFFTGTGAITSPSPYPLPLPWATPTVSGGAGFYWTANSPYLPGVWATVRRAPVGLDPAYALVPREGNSSKTQMVHISTAANMATNPTDGLENGVTITGLDPGLVITLSLPAGQTYTAWSTTGNPNINTEFSTWDGAQNIFWVIPDASPDDEFSVGSPSTVYDGYEAARVAFNALDPNINNLTFSGASSYTFYIKEQDSDPNSGGLSIQLSYPDVPDANPAHMIFECLTNTDWGMGAPSTIIDVASFEAAAVTLYGEYFGLSMMWTRQAAIEDFVSEILDHIQAVLYVDPATGLLTLKLIRDDYDAETLPELNPDNCDVTKFDRKLWGEIINEIIVTWTNPDNEQEETVTAQDLASIAMQGGSVVSASRNYYGVRYSGLATKLARRDLRTVGAPLASCEVEIDRSAYAIRPAACYKMTWPEHGLNGAVMRVMSVDYGRPGDMTIRAVLMEDVFSLDAGAYVEPEGSGWVDPSSAPEPITEARVITLPTFLAAEAVAQVGGIDPVYPEAVAGILATTDNTDTFAYDLYTQLPLPDGSLQWTSVGTNNIIGRGALAADIVAEAATTSVTVTDFSGQTQPSQGGFALIGAASDDETVMEVAMVTAVDTGTGEISLARGVMDTVPRAWPLGTAIWFVDGETLFEDRQVRSAGETVEYKLLSQTSQGQLALADAPTLSGTMTERPWLPLRPANATVKGVAFQVEGDEIDADGDATIPVTWSNRNRLTEDSQILLWTDATVTPEAGQTTTVQVLDPADRSVVTTHDGLTGTAFDLPASSFGSLTLGIVRITSECDGFESLQGHELRVRVSTGYGLGYGLNYGGA